jgi:hypothetical protein
MTGALADQGDIDVVPVETLDDVVIGLPGNGLQTTGPKEDSNKWGIVKQNPRAIFWSLSRPSSSSRTLNSYCSCG